MILSKPVITVIAITLAFPAFSQNIQTFSKAFKVHQLSDQKLSSKQKRHFAAFKKNGGYFSYFYVATDEDHSFWASHFHNLEHARLAGKAGCGYFSKSKKANCTAYAVSLPKGMNPNTKTASGLGSRAHKVFITKYPKNGKKRKGWSAFAVSGAFNFGWATGKTTKAEAADAALLFCQSSISKDLAKFPKEFRNWTLMHKYDACKIAHTIQYQ